MRVGVFSDSYRPYTSGVVTSICTMREEFTRLGHEVFIFAPSYPNYRDIEPNIFRFFSVPAPTNPGYTLAVPVSTRALRIARKLKLDIVHVHSPFILGQVGARCARRMGLPLVFTYHTLYDQYAHYVPVGQELARDLTIKYSRYFCNRCDLVITPTVDVKNMIRSYGVETPIEVVPTGVDVRRFSRGRKNWLKKDYDLPDDYKTCLFVGRLAPEKNIDFLIRSFRRVKEMYPKCSLFIVATGPLEKELKKLVLNEGMNLSQDVIFTGALTSEKLIDVYSDADVFTFASTSETQGIVVVEAMAAGLPVVAVRAIGTQEMVEDGVQGILTEPDLESFSQAVVRVLQDQELRNYLASNAVQRAESLSSQAMARKLEHLFLMLCEERQREGTG